MATATDRRRHFADPHMLFKEQYNGTSTHTCGICGRELAGLAGYRCNACNFDVHDTCAGNFDQSISSFAHRHALRLGRVRGGGGPSRSRCDLCTDECPPGSFAYGCSRCVFHAHPHCTTLPETVRSPLCAKHELRLLSSHERSRCFACRGDLPEWHYYCPCLVRLHVQCATGCTDGQSGAGAGAGGEAQDRPAARHVRSAAATKLLLKIGLRVVIHVLPGGLGTLANHLLDSAIN